MLPCVHLLPRVLASLLLLMAAALARQEQPSAADEAPVETRGFALPDTRLVQVLFDSAEAHLAAQRWNEGLADLQRVIDEHEGALLAGERAVSRAGRAADQLSYPGAARRARERLFTLPRAARQLYQERHQNDALAACDAALASLDRAALVSVARRWPLCAAAERAWWALGDLEHELGHTEEARAAWGRAIATRLLDASLRFDDARAWSSARELLAGASTAQSGAETSQATLSNAGIDARIDAALASLAADDRASSLTRRTGSLRLSSSARDAGLVPPSDADAWSSPRSLQTNERLRPEIPFDGLFAVRNAHSIYVTNTARLLALDPYSGQVRWDSGESAGFENLSDGERSRRYEAIDQQAMLLGPAASDEVVVAPLQVFLRRATVQNFQNIRIILPIPERRLAAFDARSGKPLWNHSPGADWDGESGGFAARMSVAGAPVIAGDRVLVPLVRMQGRIDYHVACYELASGALLWSTGLISGQRELNMFGRAEHEFQAAPLRVEGDRVLALTQLGALGCLDLFTGEIQWQTLYEQIPVQRAQHFAASPFDPVWRNAPPVVSGNVVLATPYDSRELIAVDLLSGAFLWGLDLGAERGAVDTLIGVRGNTIYLAGDTVLALSAPAGLDQYQRLVVAWRFQDNDLTRSGRPVLARDRVVVPAREARVELDLEQGRRLATIPWPGSESGGNLLVADGELVSLSPTRVQAVFAWDTLLARARADAARADEPVATLGLARLLANRGAAEWSRGQADAARAHLLEARTVLERALAGGEAHGAFSHELFNVLRSEARLRAGLADHAGALAALRLAREHAPHAAALRDALVEEFMLHAEREDSLARAARAELLDELAKGCADLPLAIVPAMDTLGASAQQGAATPALDATAWSFAPRPSDAPSAPTAGDAAAPREVPVGLWVELERVREAARRGDSAGELRALHAILGRHPDVQLDSGDAAELAAARVGALLRAGQRAGYEEFEARAAQELGSAREQRDRDALARIARRYPGSQAAHAANDVLLELAMEAADLGAAARVVASELPTEWNLERANERDARSLALYATAAERALNPELSGALLRALAAHHPELRVTLPGGVEESLATLAARTQPFERVAGVSAGSGQALGSFDGRFQGDRHVWGAAPAGDYELLGYAPARAALPDIQADAPRELLIAQNLPKPNLSATLMLLSSAEPDAARWSFELPPQSLPTAGGTPYWSRRVGFGAGRVVLATNQRVLALDLDSGEPAWSWTPEGEAAQDLSLCAASGVVLVNAAPRDAGERASGAAQPNARVVALDARTGVELWRAPLARAAAARAPLCSESLAVFLPPPNGRDVTVRELFTGRVASTFQLTTGASAYIDREAWLAGELLVVPAFTERAPERNTITAFDLQRGTTRWTVSIADVGGARGTSPRVLQAVLQRGARTFLVIGTWPDDQEPEPSRGLHELDTSIGALSPASAARIGARDRVLGLARPGRLCVPEGPLWWLAPRANAREGEAAEARLRAVDPDRGELWVQGLGVPFSDVPPNASVLPVLSERAAAVFLLYRDKRPATQINRCTLYSFDVSNGTAFDKQELRLSDPSDVPTAWPLGDALFVRLRARVEILR